MEIRGKSFYLVSECSNRRIHVIIVGCTNSVLDTEPTARCRGTIWINKFEMNSQKTSYSGGEE